MLVIAEQILIAAAASAAVALGVKAALSELPRFLRLAASVGGGMCMVLMSIHLFASHATAPRVVAADTDGIVREFIWWAAQNGADDDATANRSRVFASRLDDTLQQLSARHGWVIVPVGTPVAGQSEIEDVTDVVRVALGLSFDEVRDGQSE